MSAGLKRTKRNLNSRQDNQDTLDHGFYSSALRPDEKRRILDLVSEEPIDPETLVRNIKIQSLRWQIPSPPYALGAISRLIAKWSAERYRMDEAESFPETAEKQKNESVSFTANAKHAKQIKSKNESRRSRRKHD
jgi:hypothetical protein